MPMDRGVIPAVTLLNSIGIVTNESCQGHEVCDTVGVVGTVAPKISIDYSETTFAYLINCLADYSHKKKNDISLTLTKIYGSEKIKLTSGNVLALNVLGGSVRSIYLEKSLNELNEFVAFVYKGKTK